VGRRPLRAGDARGGRGHGLVRGGVAAAGFIDLDDGPELLYASQEPVSFYLSSAFMAAMGLFSASLGVRMLLHGRREAGRASRRARRVAAVGTRRR
jgi:hypothetical protein